MTPRRRTPSSDPPPPPINVGGRRKDIAVGDWNRDGKLDVVTCNDGDTVTGLLGDGRGGFTAAPASPFDLGRRAYKLVAADVNGDGGRNWSSGARALIQSPC